MQLQKKYLEILFNVLKGTEGELNLAESRIRDSFIKPVADVTDTYFKDRAKIYEAFCLRKEDGSVDFLIKDGSTSYQFPPEKLEEINKELITLGDEEVELPQNDKIPEFIDKTKYSPKVGEMEIIDEILTKF